MPVLMPVAIARVPYSSEGAPTIDHVNVEFVSLSIALSVPKTVPTLEPAALTVPMRSGDPEMTTGLSLAPAMLIAIA